MIWPQRPRVRPPTRLERWLVRHRRAVRIGLIAYAVVLFALMTYALFSDGAVPFYLVTAILNASVIIALVTVLPHLRPVVEDSDSLDRDSTPTDDSPGSGGTDGQRI